MLVFPPRNMGLQMSKDSLQSLISYVPAAESSAVGVLRWLTELAFISPLLKLSMLCCQGAGPAQPRIWTAVLLFCVGNR